MSKDKNNKKTLAELEKAKASKKKSDNAKASAPNEDDQTSSILAAKAADVKTNIKIEANEKTTFKIKIYSPYKVYYENEVESLSADNETGNFDILPGHKSFLSLLVPCEVILRGGSREDKVKVNRGVLHFNKNNATIFLDV